MTTPETPAAPRNTEEQLVGDLLTVDGKGREAKRDALCRLLGIMDPFRREELIIYAEQYRANAPVSREKPAGRTPA